MQIESSVDDDDDSSYRLVNAWANEMVTGQNGIPRLVPGGKIAAEAAKLPKEEKSGKNESDEPF